MTRMIERWFPCQEVSQNSTTGWGSGNTERNLFTWFAARPTAQAKAAMLCSLLPWPDEVDEQERLKQLVRDAMGGRYARASELERELARSPFGPQTALDPFSGRGIIPMEGARLGVPTRSVDYSPVAVLASRLLCDFPFRDWSNEPDSSLQPSAELVANRLVEDVEAMLVEVGRRYSESMSSFYPKVSGVQPWGYLWCVTLPCQECGTRFPLYGSSLLQSELAAKKGGAAIAAQYLAIEVDRSAGSFRSLAVGAANHAAPTLANSLDPAGRKVPGKSATCPFCNHVHPTAVHRRLSNQGFGHDHLLLVADSVPNGGKLFREPIDAEAVAAEGAAAALREELSFSPLIPARPNESIGPGNNNIIGPVIYGARSYGDLMNDRQTLGFVRLCRAIDNVAKELRTDGHSDDYIRALTGYASAVLVRRLRRSTRGATLMSYSDGRATGINNIYVNEGSITFSYDYLETGLGGGAGSWEELSGRTLNDLRRLMPERPGVSTVTDHGSATDLGLRTASVSVVVTDPPYDEMIAYADSSDVLYVWLKRCLATSWPELTVSADPTGTQDKENEIIVKRVRGPAPNEHRNREHYDRLIARAFQEMRRVVKDDGVVTIVFGHGEPEVWQRLLAAIGSADLVMTGSWPANTESGSHQGKANIETTLTMACRPAQSGRPKGRRAQVEAELRDEVKARVSLWEQSGLAPTDMLMAAAGPAMEVVGRYSVVLDSRGEAVDISTFLPLARAAVQEGMAIEVDHHPLDTFDARTRFALWWARLYGRDTVAKSELRWQALAASLELVDVRDLIPDHAKGCRLTTAASHQIEVVAESAVIDVVLAMATAFGEGGLQAVGEVLARSGRDLEDGYLWAAMTFLADRLPATDQDVIAWSGILRNRAGVGSAAKAVEAVERRAIEDARQMRLL